MRGRAAGWYVYVSATRGVRIFAVERDDAYLATLLGLLAAFRDNGGRRSFGAEHDAFAVAADAIGALLREARESATPDFAWCDDQVERALARVRRQSPEDADAWDWTREGVEWMDDGVISLRLYDKDLGAG